MRRAILPQHNHKSQEYDVPSLCNSVAVCEESKMEEFGSFSVIKLKQELSRRGAKTTGRKKDLVERLVAYERNNDFQGEIIDVPDSVMLEWPTSGYKQLQKNHQEQVPPVTPGLVDAYFLFRVCADRQKSGDIKAIEKGKLMLQSGKVEACSMLLKDGMAFFTGMTKASMKRKISYNFRLKLSGAGDVVNTDCECPAGKGPHATCKHVAAILLALCTLVTSGQLLVNRSCTDDLQTYNKPGKVHSGSPMKLKRPDYETEDDDPRPVKLRKRDGLQDHVRNLTINCMAVMNIPRVTLSLAFPRADVRQATIDHHYLARPMVDYWVERALKVTPKEAQDIEKATRRQSLCGKWFGHRGWRLTASRFGDVCLATPRRNMDKLCQSIVEPVDLTTDPILHGKKYEKVALEKFSQDYNLPVEPCGLFIDTERPHLAATPDGLVGDNAIVEVKCPFTGKDEKILPGKNFRFLHTDKDGTVKLKPWAPFMIQIQGQMHISKRSLCYFVVYVFNDIFVQQIPYDKDFVVNSILPKLDLFFDKHLKNYVAKAQFY